jgi:hypothetical protein
MKKIISFALILFFCSFVFAQTPPQKPLTQSEYVKLLYDLEKNPGKRDAIVEIVRKRGIGFPVTNGLRSLTSIKSRGDAELKRTLEESARRLSNPQASQLPNARESSDILAKAREATLVAVADMPDFVVKQMIQRADAYAGTNNFRNRDRLVVAVSYRSPDVAGARGAEEYRILSVDGVQKSTFTKSSPKLRRAIVLVACVCKPAGDAARRRL